MAMNPNVLLLEQTKLVVGLASVVPSSTTPQRVSLKTSDRLTIIMTVANGVSPVGSAITLQQSQSVTGTGEKALVLVQAWRNLNTAATDTLVNFSVASNTFTTDTTASVNQMYVIEISESDLDTANNFNYVRIGTGNATNATLTVTYVLWPQNYGKATPPTVVT